MRRPYDCLGRSALTPDSASLCPLLQRFENAPIVGQRRAILAPGSADRSHHVACAPRRTASPLHASLSFRHTQPALTSAIAGGFRVHNHNAIVPANSVVICGMPVEAE